MDGDESDDEAPALQLLDESIGVVAAEDDVPILQNIDAPKHDDLPPVPVTILTGFLGSGKTTLVRHILTSPEHQKRIAVIENEYGGGEGNAQLAERLGLTVNDASTLSVETMIARDGTDGSNLADFIELPNGCVCCTVKDSLVETLESLLSKRSDLDYVIIEASGMADPGPVASIFWLDEALESRIRLDGIVTCVDAKNIQMQLESTSSAAGAHGDASDGGDEAARQIAFADRIIINKTDLLRGPTGEDTMGIEEVRETIQSINPTTPIKTTIYSKVEDLGWILDANCFDAERAKDIESAFQQSVGDDNDDVGEETPNVSLNDMRCSHPACNGHHAPNEAFCGVCVEPTPPPIHQHTSAVRTIALFGRGSVDLHKINTYLADILWPNQDESDKILSARLEEGYSPDASGDGRLRDKQKIYRVKGILSVRHAVGPTGTVVPDEWAEEGASADFVSPDDGLDRRRYIVQAVNDLWDVLPASRNLCWGADETRCCKVVVIGKWLNESQLQKGFVECFASEQ